MKNLISRLSLNGKFGMVVLTMLVPIIVLATISTRGVLTNYQVARAEISGLQWATPLIAVEANLAEYSEHALAVAGGAADERGEMQEHAGAVRAAAAELDTLARGGSELTEASGWAALAPRVRAALEGDGGQSQQQAVIHQLVADVDARVVSVAEASGLVLDPSADTYALMTAAILELPQGIEVLASARRALNQIIAGDATVNTRAVLAAHSSRAGLQLSRAMHALLVNYAGTDDPNAKILDAATTSSKHIDDTLAEIGNVGSATAVGAAARELSGQIEILTEDLSALRTQVDAELGARLDARAKDARSLMIFQVTIMICCLLVALWVTRGVTKYIGGKLHQADETFQLLAKGNFDSELGPQPGDEFGRLLTALDDMQSVLRTRGVVDADFRGQIAAIGKSQAVIEFGMDGRVLDANDNFLQVLGFSLGEVKGQHHSMFVDPEYRQSADYRVFWDKLGRGEYDAGQYKRIGKGGREVWIQASYNPIVDVNGKAVKVVKYATDVTQQVLLSQQLQTAVQQTQDTVKSAIDGDLTQRIPLAGKTGEIEVLCQGRERAARLDHGAGEAGEVGGGRSAARRRRDLQGQHQSVAANRRAGFQPGRDRLLDGTDDLDREGDGGQRRPGQSAGDGGTPAGGEGRRGGQLCGSGDERDQLRQQEDRRHHRRHR